MKHFVWLLTLCVCSCKPTRDDATVNQATANSQQYYTTADVDAGRERIKNLERHLEYEPLGIKLSIEDNRYVTDKDRERFLRKLEQYIIEKDIGLIQAHESILNEYGNKLVMLQEEIQTLIFNGCPLVNDLAEARALMEKAKIIELRACVLVRDENDTMLEEVLFEKTYTDPANVDIISSSFLNAEWIYSKDLSGGGGGAYSCNESIIMIIDGKKTIVVVAMRDMVCGWGESRLLYLEDGESFHRTMMELIVREIKKERGHRKEK